MKNLFIAAAALTLAVCPLAIGHSSDAWAQSDTGSAASGGVAGGNSEGSAGSAAGGNGPSATGTAASGGVAGGNSVGAAGSAAGGTGPSATGVQASGGVAGANAGGVSDSLSGLAELGQADREAAVQALSAADVDALSKECQTISVGANEYSAEVVAVCSAME